MDIKLQSDKHSTSDSVTNNSISSNHTQSPSSTSRTPTKTRLAPSDRVNEMRMAVDKNSLASKAHRWAIDHGYGTALVATAVNIPEHPKAPLHLLSCYKPEIVSNVFEEESVLANQFEKNPELTVGNWAILKGYESGRLNGETDNSRLGIACIKRITNTNQSSSRLREVKGVSLAELNSYHIA